MARSAFRILFPLSVLIASFPASGCMTAPDQSTTAMHGLGSAEALARTWSDAARLVGVFGVQANGVTQIRMTPPWASTPAVFDLPGPGADA